MKLKDLGDLGFEDIHVVRFGDVQNDNKYKPGRRMLILL